MELQKQHGMPACMLFSAAMVLDIPANEVIEDMVARDYEINLETSPHIQELVDYFFDKGYLLTEIEYNPQQQLPLSGTILDTFDARKRETRFSRYLDGHIGLYLVRLPGGTHHMCAWDGTQVYDPKGYVANRENHRGEPLAFFMVTRIGL